MKVKIGPFLTWWGPYQISDLLQHVGFSEDRCHEIGEKLSKTWVNNVCEWIYEKRKRTVKIKIDKYDTWGMDSTLAMLIVPMLKQLKATKHGSPFTDDEDVPEALRSTSAPPKEHEWDIDDFLHDRWEWIMDELIWTFEQLHPESDWESQYFSGESAMKFSDDNKILFEKSDNYKFDSEGHKAHNARISNGLRLFGRYYQGLWD